MITVILTMYNRPMTIMKQLECLSKQTIVPQEIWVWKNHSDTNKEQHRHLMQVSRKYPDVKIVDAHFNLKYHGRFALAQLARTEFVAVMDDDMFPDRKWFENCIASIKTHPGIMGGMGVRLLQNAYSPNKKFGWQNHQLPSVEKVDVCCQSWFFRKEWLKYLWYEEPITWENGEDIHFSYCAKKYGQIQSYVPPHPISDTGLWACDNTIGDEYASDRNATWRTDTHQNLRDSICRTYIEKGWGLVRYPHK